MRVRRIAILIDGGFYLKRLKHILPESYYDTPESVARSTAFYCKNHILKLTGCSSHKPQAWREHVYRFFFYDAVPFSGTVHNPISNLQINYSKTPEYEFRQKLFEELRKRRNFALRLGKVEKEGEWTPSNQSDAKKLLRVKKFLDRFQEGSATMPSFNDTEQEEWAKCLEIWKGLNAGNIKPGFKQKGVDMRVGVDIASLTLKKHVDTIILCTGDSDFVPAAKLARREGVEFILDPLGQNIKEDLNEHIDGIVNGFPPKDKLERSILEEDQSKKPL